MHKKVIEVKEKVIYPIGTRKYKISYKGSSLSEINSIYLRKIIRKSKNSTRELNVWILRETIRKDEAISQVNC